MGGIALVAEKGGRCRFEQPCVPGAPPDGVVHVGARDAVRRRGDCRGGSLGGTDYAFNATVGARCTISPGKWWTVCAGERRTVKMYLAKITRREHTQEHSLFR